MPFTNAYALVVGVGQYQNMSQYNVPIAANDAQAVSAALQDPARCGYPAGQVSLLTNQTATRGSILATLDELSGKLDPESTLFMFYVGHGVYATDGSYQLTAHDTQLQGTRVIPGTGISELELIDKLRKMQAKRLLLVINACHSGELSPSFEIGSQSLASEAPPQKLSAALLSTGEGRITITACRPEQQSWIGSGSLSVFTRAVVSGLKGEAPNNRGYISAFGLYEYIYFSAKEAAAALGQTQEPELTVLKGVGPFPVALYRGADATGSFDTSEPIPADTATREVSPESSQRSYQNYQVAINRGDGAIAQGQGAKAVGKNGILIEGSVNGNIVIGNHNKINDS